MVKLRTPKVAGALKRLTKLRPVLRCVTRWSGTFLMISRFFELKEFVTTLINIKDDPHQLADFTLGQRNITSLKNLFDNLKKLNSIMLELQSPSLSISTVRVFFDSTVAEFPSMYQQPSACAASP